MKDKAAIVAFVMFLLLSADLGVKAHSAETENGKQVVRSNDDERVKKLKADATVLIEALSKKDFATFADLTIPQVVEMFGGKDKYIANLLEDSKSPDEVFEKTVFVVGDPHEVVANSNTLFAFVPFRLEATTPKKTVIVTNAGMVGVSKDSGATWKFVSDSAFIDIFPEMKGRLNIPESKIEIKDGKQ